MVPIVDAGSSDTPAPYPADRLANRQVLRNKTPLLPRSFPRQGFPEGAMARLGFYQQSCVQPLRPRFGYETRS